MIVEENTFNQIEKPSPCDLVNATLEKTRKGWMVTWVDDPYFLTKTEYLSSYIQDLFALPSILDALLAAWEDKGTVKRDWGMTCGRMSYVSGIKDEATARRLYAFICTYLELIFTAAPSGRGQLDIKDRYRDIRGRKLGAAQ